MKSKKNLFIIIFSLFVCFGCSREPLTKSADEYCHQGAQLILKGEYERAIVECKKAIRKDPKHRDAYGSLADAYYQLGDYKKAKKYYEKAIALDPDNPILLIGRAGLILKTTPDRKEARKLALAELNKAKLKKKDLENPGVLYNLACFYAEIGDSQRALNYLRKSVGKNSFFRQVAKQDKDLDSLRDLAEFKALIGSGKG